VDVAVALARPATLIEARVGKPRPRRGCCCRRLAGRRDAAPLRAVRRVRRTCCARPGAPRWGRRVSRALSVHAVGRRPSSGNLADVCRATNGLRARAWWRSSVGTIGNLKTVWSAREFLATFGRAVLSPGRRAAAGHRPGEGRSTGLVAALRRRRRRDRRVQTANVLNVFEPRSWARRFVPPLVRGTSPGGNPGGRVDRDCTSVSSVTQIVPGAGVGPRGRLRGRARRCATEVSSKFPPAPASEAEAGRRRVRRRRLVDRPGPADLSPCPSAFFERSPPRKRGSIVQRIRVGGRFRRSSVHLAGPR